MRGPFVHLHNHSDYSLLDGALSLRKMIQAAKVREMPALALTDHGNIFGAIAFYQEARRVGIKPILGMEAYTTSGSRHEHSGGMRGAGGHHLILLARNLTGWHNLIKLSSYAYLEGFYYKPRLDRELLRRHSEGLIATTACMSGEVNRLLAQGNDDAARVTALELAEIFGEGNFYLEVQNHGIEEEERIREGALRLARETGLPLVGTNDCHYLEKGDHEAHEALICINTGRDLEGEGGFRGSNPELYFKSSEEMAEVFAEIPEAYENTRVIAERCELELPLGKNLLPNFPLPEGSRDPESHLEELSRQGLEHRYGSPTPEQEKRLNYELDVIRQMGFAGYFLITQDFINVAREKGIAVGPGRGSAAGSLVCYALGITDIDPLEYGLIFERFLNPERVSMPDIDIDFDYERRGEVISYVTEKYGRENVCQIITFGTMKARAVVRDVGRVLGLPYSDVDRIAKMVPDDLGMTLEKAFKMNPDLAALRGESEVYEKLLRFSLTLEGLTRHASTHAAGVLITPTPLVEHVPLYKNNKDEITTQWDMVACEQVGMLKMDFLGLRTLTVIENALGFINAGRSGEKPICAEDIPLDDAPSYEMLRRGETVGLFQIESGGMRDILTRLKPEAFEEIIAVNALFRPGPLGSGMVDDYIDRKWGRKRTEYPHPDLQPILEETYGTILYQEQVMQITSVFAGFSMGQADLLRKAMGKKKPELLARLKEDFIQGAASKGHEQRKAVELFDLLEFFAGYGFNKSHSAAYALLTMRTAWLKAHHPAAFLAACMTSEMSGTGRIVVFMNECRDRGIEVVPPDVRHSWKDFREVDGRIYFGMAAVKNVGEGAIEEIVAAREREEGFRDLHHFCESVDLHRVNKKVFESLIMAGAMDSLGPNRPSLLAGLENAMRSAQSRQRDRACGQLSLLDGLDESDSESARPVTPELPEWERGKCLAQEKEVLGFFVSGHPLDEYREAIRALDVADTDRLRAYRDKRAVRSVGLISAVLPKMDSKGKPMVFLTVEDFLGSYEIIVFSSVYKDLRDRLQVDSILAFEGKVSSREDGDFKILLDKALSLDEALRDWPRQVHLHLTGDFQPDWLAEIQDELARHPGAREVFFHLLGEEGRPLTIRARGIKVETGPWLNDFLARNAERLQCSLTAPSENGAAIGAR